MKIETIGALGQAHGELYIELQEARGALNSALEEMGNLQESCARLRDEARNLRASLAAAERERDEAIAQVAVLGEVLTRGAQVDLAGMLEWTADRLVHVHGENPNVDYVLTLRDRAKRCRLALANLPASATALLERDRASRKRIEELEKALKLMIDWFGGPHEKDCPEDDTCDCPSAKIVNKALASAQDGNNE